MFCKEGPQKIRFQLQTVVFSEISGQSKMKTFIKRCSKNRGESLNFDSIQDNIFSVIVICHNHIDRYIYFVAAKESVESMRPSVIVVSHTPNQLIKHQGFLRSLRGTFWANFVFYWNHIFLLHLRGQVVSKACLSLTNDFLEERKIAKERRTISLGWVKLPPTLQ